MSEIKDIIAKNLTNLRIKKQLTQIELAQKINYTDKSISKWEHGDATPPIDVLKELADLYGVTLDYLVSEEPQENYDKIYASKKNSTNKFIITLLASSIIWLIATMLFVYGSMFGFLIRPWLAFIWAIPASSIILLIFNFIWGKRKLTFILISALIWTIIAAIYLTLIDYNTWMLFIIGIPLQIAVVLWSQLKRTK